MKRLALLALVFLAAASGVAADVLNFDNTTPIVFPADPPGQGVANPYPSTIIVSGITGTINNITVSIFDVNHTFPDDMGALVTSPLGNSVLLFDAPGGGTDVVGLNWTFDDNAATTLPATGTLVSGTFRPGLDDNGDIFDAPAPGSPYGTAFSPIIVAQDLNNVNGTWSLFAQDFVGQDTGNFNGGWRVTIDFTPSAVPEPTTLVLGGAALGGVVLTAKRVRARRAKKAEKK